MRKYPRLPCTYAEMFKMVKKKERKDEDVYELPEDVAQDEAPDLDVIDLVEVLKRSLRSGDGAPRKRPKPAAPRKRTRKRTTAK